MEDELELAVKREKVLEREKGCKDKIMQGREMKKTW